MARKRKVLKIDDGITFLDGYDVGKFPKHHFTFAKGTETQVGWPLKILSTGDDEWVDGCHRRRRNSQIFSLEFVVEGTFRFMQNGKAYITGPGNVFLVRLGADNEMSVHKGRYAKKKVMEISGTILPVLLNLTGLDKCDIIRPLDIEWLTERFDKCYELCQKTPPGFMTTCSSIVYEILVELGRAAVNSEFPNELQKIMAFMEQNIGNTISVAGLCHDFGFSKASLHRMFRQHLKQSPIEYFISLKIESAKNMLIASHYSIKEITQQLGYSNQLYFSAEFKKRVGVSPCAFRKKA